MICTDKKTLGYLKATTYFMSFRQCQKYGDSTLRKIVSLQDEGIQNDTKLCPDQDVTGQHC